MQKYRKKPVVIEAVQYDGSYEKAAEIKNWVWNNGGQLVVGFGSIPPLTIKTLEGNMEARSGDWIIRGIKGEFYPCAPDIFEATYDVVEEDDENSGNYGPNGI